MTSLKNCDTLVLPEAGGNAALSIISFIKDYDPSLISKLVVSDTNYRVRQFYNNIGIPSISYTEYHLNDQYKEIANRNSTYLPSNEYWDEYFNYINPPLLYGRSWIINDLPKLHDKSYQYDLLLNSPIQKSSKLNFHLPKRLDTSNFKIVIRGNKSAGCKDLQIKSVVGELIDDKDKIVTEYINFQYELVIDFCKKGNDIHYIVRKSLNMKYGSDTMVEFMDPSTVFYDIINYVCKSMSDYIGVGNIQLGVSEDGALWFIEFATRVSGFSRVGLLHGYNPIKFLEGSAKEVSINNNYRFIDCRSLPDLHCNYHS